MMMNGQRTIKVNKANLIKTIKDNKEQHIKDYAIAVEAYAVEAGKQLKIQNRELKKGSLNIKLKLTTPVNATKNYDDIIQMFEWEVEKEVTLEQDEFREYVQDETSFAKNAKFSNSMYTAGR